MARTTQDPSTDASDPATPEAYSAPRLDDLGSLADLTQGTGGPDDDGLDGFVNSNGPG